MQKNQKGKSTLSYFILMILSLIFLCPANVFAAPYIPTTEKLKIITSPHFRVIYQEPLADSAPLIAEYCEEAYDILTKVFEWVPKGKITVLYQDGFDTHNGWATSVPHNVMSIFAAGSEPGSSIYQPGSYLKRTIFHELTHILGLDMRYGYNKTLSGIFGKVVPIDLFSYIVYLFTSSPVSLSPRWFLEGMAIWSETEFVPPGRGKSSFAEMIMRCAVRDHNQLPYSEWYLQIPHWPHGLAAYLYGMKFFQHLYETDPYENPVGELTREVAHSFLFNLDSASRRYCGKSWKTLSIEMLAHERAVQNRNLEKLRNVPGIEPPRLTPQELFAYNPVFVNDRVYFSGAEEERRTTLYVYYPALKRLQKIFTARTTAPFGSLTASRDGKYIYYTRLNIQENQNAWYEIRRFDTRTLRDTLLTNQGRYSEIDISPDGTRFAAISQRGGKSYLLELEIEMDGTIKEQLLTSVPVGHDLSAPRYSSNGNRISFVEADENDFSLQVYDRDKNIIRTVLENKSQILNPVWHPNKESIVFSSDDNGVYNLYEIAEDGPRHPVPLTHVTGGLFFPSFAPDGKTIAATGFDGFGPHLTIIAYQADSLADITLPSVSSSWKGGRIEQLLQKQKIKKEMVGIDKEDRALESADYNSFTNIRPDYWVPWLTASAKGVEYGAGASFSDPTRYQEIAVFAGRESEYDSKLGAVHYYFRGLYPEFHLYATASQGFYYDLLVEKGTGNRFDHAEEVTRFGTAVEFPLLKMEQQLSLQAGYEFMTRTFIKEVEDDYKVGDIAVQPTDKDESLVWAKVSYFNGTYFRRSSSVEDGRLISLGAEVSDEALGGDISKTLFITQWDEYLRVPIRKNHVLKLSGLYGFGSGDTIAQGLFGLGGMASIITNTTPGIPQTQGVRGYPDNFQTGDRVMKTVLSYRFPIFDLSKGFESFFPIYLRQLFGEVYYEGGRTWDDTGYGDDLKWINALGVESNFALTFLRNLMIAPGAGIVYTPDISRRDPDDEEVTIYINVKGWVNF